MAKLYLIPNFLSQEGRQEALSGFLVASVQNIRLFFVEEPKSARALLKKLGLPLAECTLVDLNEHTAISQIEENFSEHLNQDMGIISEAGYPCVADPGAALVRLAHEKHIQVVPLAGASSIILALAASGLNGQNFAFNGYLPRDRAEKIKKIKLLEQRSRQEGQTQIIMEAPYRSQSFYEDLLFACHPSTLLCVACDLTGPNELVQTCSIEQWKRKSLRLQKMPTLFLLLYN